MGLAALKIIILTFSFMLRISIVEKIIVWFAKKKIDFWPGFLDFAPLWSVANLMLFTS